MSLIAIALALLVGATLGLFGGGGAILTIPVFVYAMGIDPVKAVPMSFFVIGTSSAIGALVRWQQNHIHPALGLRLGVFAVLGAYAGARVSHAIPIRVRMVLFGVAVLLAAFSMVRSAARYGTPKEVSRPLVHASFAIAAMTFAIIGAFTGIVGVGGGFLFVPALIAFLGVPMIEATGLSLMIISMNAVSAFAGYAGRVAIDYRLALIFTGVVVVGMIPAGVTARRLPVPTLKRAFVVVLFAIGAFVLVDNLR